MARRRTTKVSIQTNLMLDTLIAILLVQKVPGLLNKFLFAGNPVTGQTSVLLGAGAAYLYGMFFKNNNVANIGLALGAVEFVSPFIDQFLTGMGVDVIPAGMPVGQLPGVSPAVNAVNVDRIGSGYFRMSDYGTLDDYVYDPSVTPGYNSYRESY